MRLLVRALRLAVRALWLLVRAVRLAVHPYRAGTQYRAARRSLGRLAGDHRRHVAVTDLPGVAGRLDDEPGAAGHVLFNRYFY